MRQRQIGTTFFLCALLAVTAVGAQSDGSSSTYLGRAIADVMSWRGAPWLERDSRVAEEDPDALLAELPLEPGDTAVDLGCGSGYFARRMSRLVGAPGRVLCVDIQREMLEIARRLAEAEGISNMEYIKSDSTDPKLAPGSVDVMVLVDVYHEMAEPAPMLEAMHRALKPDGVIALAEFRLEGDSAAHIKLEHRMSVEQVLREWQGADFKLRRLINTLPTQHLFLFERAPVEEPTKDLLDG